MKQQCHIEPIESVWYKSCIEMDKRAVEAMVSAGYIDKEEKKQIKENKRLRRIHAIKMELKRRKDPRVREMAKAAFISGIVEGLKHRTCMGITAEVAAQYGVSIEDIQGPWRAIHLVEARHEVFYRCRTETGLSMPQIGKKLNRDHTTVGYGAERHAERNGLPSPSGGNFKARMKRDGMTRRYVESKDHATLQMTND